MTLSLPRTRGALPKSTDYWYLPLRSSRSLYNCHGRCYSTPISSPADRSVRILEVGARDGLQNIKTTVPTSVKVELIQRLAATGLRNIEATSFVSPKWVPQLADGAEVMRQLTPLRERGDIRFPVLAPNAKGLENALAVGAKEVLVFASATEPFSKSNQNCTVEEALAQAQVVADAARKKGILVRGAVSCIFGDPYGGPTAPSTVLRVVQRLLDMGCYEVSLGDTLGIGTPNATQTLLETLLRDVPASSLAGHFHDTYGQAVANVMKAYDMGLRSFDSSVAGLGGCPYAVGAKGNLSSEDIIYAFEKGGIDTGVDLQRLVETGHWISQQLGIPNGSRAGSAILAKQQTPAKPQSPSEGTSTARAWKVTEDTGEYRVARSGSAVKVTLTRSRNGNALTATMLNGLTALFKRIANDSSIFHVIISSEGKFFSTGMDLSGGTNTTDFSGKDNYFTKVLGLYEALDNLPQTTIAAIDGPCFGGGVGLGFVCDIRLASPKARWTLSEIKIGVAPAIISKYIVREWGPSFSREAILTGREVTPQELHRIGAIHGLSDGAKTIEQMVEEKLTQLEKCAPQSASRCKKLVRVAWSDPTSNKQATMIQEVFENMMSPNSEGRHGISQFQKKIKDVDWAAFWSQNSTTT